MTASYSLIPIPLDSASAANSPARFRVEILAIPEFSSGVVSPSEIASVLAAHPLFAGRAPQTLRALVMHYDDWRAAPQRFVAGGAGVTSVTLHYAGDTEFGTLLDNLRTYLFRSSPMHVEAVRHDDTHDKRSALDFVDLGATHKQIVQLRKTLATHVAHAATLSSFTTPRDLSDQSVAYARRRWLHAGVQSALLHLLRNRVEIANIELQATPSDISKLHRDIGAVARRLDPATTAPRPSGSKFRIQGGPNGGASADDPNVAIHAALTEELVARACGLVTSWTADSAAPLKGDYVLVLDPAAFPADGTVVFRKTALRRNEATHPLSHADLGRATTNGGLAMVTDTAGHPRYTCISVNAETAIVQATILQAGNSLSNSGAPAAPPAAGQRDDRPPVELSSEQFGVNEMEAVGLTFSAPAEDLVVPDPLKSTTREADLPCLFLEDLWTGYKLDLAAEGDPLRSTHRQIRCVTFSSGKVLRGESEDFTPREPANQMDTAVSTEILRYTGMSTAQAVEYSRFLGTYQQPAATPGAPFTATAEQGIDATPLRFGQNYAYRLRNVFQGGVSLRHDDPGLPMGQSTYVGTTRFERGRSFRAGEIVGSVHGGPDRDTKQMFVFLSEDAPKLKILIAPAPVDPDIARYNGQFLNGADEPERDADRAFVSDLPNYLAKEGIEAPYYCDPEVSEIGVELWMRNGAPESTGRSFIYREGAYCEVVQPLHLGPASARFGANGDWRRFRPIEVAFKTTCDAKPKLHVDRDGSRVEVLVPLFAEIDVVFTPMLSSERLTRALDAASEGLTSDWPVVEHRIRVIHCAPEPAMRPVIVTEVGAVGPRSAFVPLLKRERLSAPAQLIGRIDVDAASTGSLQIEGSWEEIDDSPFHPRFLLQAGRCVSRPRSLTFSDYVPPAPTAAMASLLGGKGASVISHSVQNIGKHCAENKLFLGGVTPLPGVNPDTAECALPLPDTRRRRISCIATGRGRYEAHFPDKSATAVEARSEAVVCDVPASMPLPAPQISHILPIVREFKTRDGNRNEARRLYGFRIYVRRPWFLSGLGERLAIGCHTGAVPTGPRANLNKLFTQWGEDPIQRLELDASRALPRAMDFRGALSNDPFALEDALYPPDSPEGSDPVLYFDDVIRDTDALASDDARLALASLALHWDDVLKLWYCDLELAKPFAGWVGLALYRHQPHAHDGLQLSRSATWVYSMVIQGEQVSWVRHGDRVHVTIGPVFDKTLSFEVAREHFRDGVSEPLGRDASARLPFDTFAVEDRTYFEGIFDVSSKPLCVVRRRFGFDLSSFSLEG
ncbi:hypothetical protein NK214_05600 [Chromobacterium sp. S0633]|uniref:hypothetical protein n=1 Tax=Chromobacterium sp. S0633 TaxID=2957805 RepID=UPI00209E1420|nr:hypothetical protein [Chromobacterium sp. S0633]MCP1289661.1 hypothetical protein [Chromobacterium sp. S0633]